MVQDLFSLTGNGWTEEQEERQMDSYSYFSNSRGSRNLLTQVGVAGAFLSPDRDQKYSSACPFFR